MIVVLPLQYKHIASLEALGAGAVPKPTRTVEYVDKPVL